MRKTIDELKSVLDELEYEYSPNTPEQIAAAKERLGLSSIPAVLEEYFLKIGWFNEICDAGTGVHFMELDDLYILTAEKLKADRPGQRENETDDYLIFGTESMSVDTFAVKVSELDLPDLPIYIWGDSTHHVAVEKGLMFDRVETLPYMSDFIELVALSAEEA